MKLTKVSIEKSLTNHTPSEVMKYKLIHVRDDEGTPEEIGTIKKERLNL